MIAAAVVVVVVVGVAVGLKVYLNSDGYKIEKYMKLARSSYEDGDYREVRSYCQEVLEIDNTLVDAYRILSDSYLALGDCLKAVQTLMDGVQNTESEELSERENYVREHIVISSEIRYIDGSMSLWYEYEYEYDAAGNQIKYTSYNGDGSMSWWYE